MTESTERKYNPSVCESCGEAFGCGAKLDGCWCSEISLSEKSAENIKSNFSDCLCHKCLEEFASPVQKQ